MNIFDAIGLGAFTVVGIDTAVTAGYGDYQFLLIFLGVITGVGGGILRDIMAGQTPYVLRKHVYACASIAGALLYVFLIDRIHPDAAKMCIRDSDSPYDANEAYQLLTEEVRAFADIYNGRQQTSSPSGYQQRPAQNRPAGTRPAPSRSAASAQRSPQRPQTRTAQSRSSQGSVSRTGGTARTSASRPAAAGSSRGTASSRSGQRPAHSGSRSRRRPANQSFDP